jgi:hypothetical protein
LIGALSGNTDSASTRSEAEVIVQHAFHDRAQVGGGRKVAALVEVGGYGLSK